MEPLSGAIAYALAGIMTSATNIIIESAMEAGLEVTIDYVTTELNKVFPDVANPESFWGKFASNIKMNASAQMQAKIMTQAMQVQNTATDYIEGLKEQRIAKYNSDCDNIDSTNPTFSESVGNANVFEYVTLKPFRDGSMLNGKIRNAKKSQKKEELNRDLNKLDGDLNNFQNTRNTGNHEAKTFSNSYADYNQSENSQMTDNPVLTKKILQLIEEIKIMDKIG